MESEGKYLKAYKCPAGKWTIGYGHTKNVFGGMTISEQEAAGSLLDEDVAECEICLNSSNLNINQNQYDACIDFIFNFGCRTFRGSTLFRYLNAGQMAKAAMEFNRWVYGNVNGKMVKLPGLITRRQKETDLFNTPC